MVWRNIYYHWPGFLGLAAVVLVSTGTALAQDQQDSRQNRGTDENRRTDSQSDSREQESRSDRHDQQQYGQDRQSQQQYDRENVNRNQRVTRNQRDARETRRDDSRSDQWTRDENRRDQSGRRGNQDDQDAGLGVNIVESSGQGVTVTRVHPGSPAEEMGLRQGDRITHFNGQLVRSVQGFISAVTNQDPGTRVELDVQRRGGQRRNIEGELETRQEALVLRSQSRGGRSDFGQQRGMQYGDQFGGTQNISARLSSLERQISQLSRELEQIRNSVRQDGRFAQQPRNRSWDGGESPANYYESSDDRTRRSQMQNDRSGYDTPSSRQYNDGSGSRDEWDSPGGAIGSDRMRPGTSDQDW